MKFFLFQIRETSDKCRCSKVFIYLPFRISYANSSNMVTSWDVLKDEYCRVWQSVATKVETKLLTWAFKLSELLTSRSQTQLTYSPLLGMNLQQQPSSVSINCFSETKQRCLLDALKRSWWKCEKWWKNVLRVHSSLFTRCLRALLMFNV